MNPARWFFSLLQQLLSDALFKRPVELTLKRNADGSFDMKTNVNPSGQQPQHHYYGAYPPYGQFGGYPPNWPQYPTPMTQTGPFVQPAPPPGSAPPANGNRPTDHFPEEYTA